ncbi:MAG: hypothetical protein WDZ62_00670 [Candidatus Pacearchaeota archaeon]
MVKENLIHIRLDYSESIDAKKDILSSQMGLLKIAGNMKDYYFYRSEEIEFKQLLYKKIKEFKSSLGLLEKTLPKAKIPQILKEENYKKDEKTKNRRKPSGDIEEQLEEIQRRLRELQERNV